MRRNNSAVFTIYKSEGRQRKKSLNINYCVEPGYLMCRIFGLLPFSIKYNVNGSIKAAKVNILDAFWFIGAIGLNLFFSYREVTNTVFLDIDSSVLYLIFRTVSFVNYILIAFSIVMDMLNRNRIINILNDLISFDNIVS